MNRELVLQNLMINYGNKYGIPRKLIEEMIDDETFRGMNYDAIYLMVRMTLANITGEKEYATSDEVARAFEMSDEEMCNTIQNMREELIAEGENPDDYFKEVTVSRYMM